MDSGPHPGPDDSAAGLNLVTVLIVLVVAIVVVAAVVWLFTGSGFFAHGGAAPTPTNPPTTPAPPR